MHYGVCVCHISHMTCTNQSEPNSCEICIVRSVSHMTYSMSTNHGLTCEICIVGGVDKVMCEWLVHVFTEVKDLGGNEGIFSAH